MDFLFEGSTIGYEPNETVLDALLRHGHDIPHRCKVGACQSCLMQSKGNPAPAAATAGLSDDLVEKGYFLACKADPGAIGESRLPAEPPFQVLRATVREHTMLTADVLLLRVELMEAVDWRCGQFVKLRVGDVERSYSIAELTDGTVVTLHIRLIPGGAMGESLRNGVVVGTELDVVGPFGSCVYRAASPEQPILMIASGTGLAPIYGILIEALERGHTGPIEIFHGGATLERLYFAEELKALAMSRPNVRYVPCVDDGPPDLARIASPLGAALEDHPRLGGWRVYVCGHPELVRHAKRKTYIAGADLSSIHADPFVDQSAA